MIPAFALRTGSADDPLAGVAVVFAPWIEPGEAIARAVAAGASLVRLGVLPSIVIVSPADRGYASTGSSPPARSLPSIPRCSPPARPPSSPAESPAMADLDVFRSTIARVLFALAFLHVPLLALITWGLGRTHGPFSSPPPPASPSCGLCSALKRPMSAVAMALAVALVGQTSLLVFAFTGHPWQVEMHFYYFAVLAMLSGSATGASSSLPPGSSRCIT